MSLTRLNLIRSRRQVVPQLDCHSLRRRNRSRRQRCVPNMRAHCTKFGRLIAQLRSQRSSLLLLNVSEKHGRRKSIQTDQAPSTVFTVARFVAFGATYGESCRRPDPRETLVRKSLTRVGSTGTSMRVLTQGPGGRGPLELRRGLVGGSEWVSPCWSQSRWDRALVCAVGIRSCCGATGSRYVPKRLGNSYDNRQQPRH